MTAAAIRDAQSAPKPSLITSLLLREQHFGIAEQKPWGSSVSGMAIEDLFAQGIFPQLYGRSQRFPEGESQDDLHGRAQKFVRETLLPQIRQAAMEKVPEMHVAIVSHGMFITELIATLFELETLQSTLSTFHGDLQNTAWTRIHVEMKVISIAVSKT